MKSQSNPQPQLGYISYPNTKRTINELLQILIDECEKKINNREYYSTIIQECKNYLKNAD